MSVRRKTTNRLTLYRTCHACGRVFRTTADHPFIRQIPADGKKQKTCYFCCESCWRASYAHPGWWDGMKMPAERPEKPPETSGRRTGDYYAAHAEELRQRARERYWSDPEAAREDNRYQRQKRRMQSA